MGETSSRIDQPAPQSGNGSLANLIRGWQGFSLCHFMVGIVADPTGQQFGLPNSSPKVKQFRIAKGQMLRGTNYLGLRLGYRTLFGHHDFGLAFWFASGGRNKPFPGSIYERKQENVIAFAGASLAGFRDAAMKPAH